jgi:hypothetical protein
MVIIEPFTFIIKVEVLREIFERSLNRNSHTISVPIDLWKHRFHPLSFISILKCITIFFNRLSTLIISSDAI